MSELQAILNRQKYLELIFKDQTHFNIPAETLRARCPCSICVKITANKSMLKVLDQDLSNLEIVRIERVGNYAIKPYFSDGHSTGIFPIQQLLMICATLRNSIERST
ncbi:MAG: DUF971 domain-containing protein [Deltaproteobacteria bacterium]|nr:DUF971 domain-containing protein [Deltaproteobacteria bacterium]